MGKQLHKTGFGTIAALVGVNLLLGMSAVGETLADDGDFTCDEPSDNCYCFGPSCEDDFPGMDQCLKGWYWYEGRYILDPIIEEGKKTGETCGPPPR